MLAVLQTSIQPRCLEAWMMQRPFFFVTWKKQLLPGTPKNQSFFIVVSIGWFQIITIKNDCFTKHPFKKNGCLGYQVCINQPQFWGFASLIHAFPTLSTRFSQKSCTQTALSISLDTLPETTWKNGIRSHGKSSSKPSIFRCKMQNSLVSGKVPSKHPGQRLDPPRDLHKRCWQAESSWLVTNALGVWPRYNPKCMQNTDIQN